MVQRLSRYRLQLLIASWFWFSAWMIVVNIY